MIFSTVVADPAWSFSDDLPGETRGAAKNYRVMSVEDICALSDGRSITMCGQRFDIADDALLFLWRVASMPEEALRVVRAWGFVPKAEMVWLKRTTEGGRWFGLGRFTRAEHETCIIAARGKASTLIRSHSVRSTFKAVVEGHSVKPKRFYDIVEELAKGPFLELFSRRQRDGWTCAGDEMPSAEAAQ